MNDSERQLIWREMGARFHSSNIRKRDCYGGPRVLVCEGIMVNGRTELHIFDGHTVNRDRCCHQIILPHVRLFRGAIGVDFIFIDDNARPHRTRAVEELLASEDIAEWIGEPAPLI